MMLYLFGTITTFAAIVSVMYFIQKDRTYGTFFALMFLNGAAYLASQILPVTYYPVARIILLLAMAAFGGYIILLLMQSARNNK